MLIGLFLLAAAVVAVVLFMAQLPSRPAASGHAGVAIRLFPSQGRGTAQRPYRHYRLRSRHHADARLSRQCEGRIGALWNGAASVEEKQFLAEALLAAACAPGAVSLDEIAPKRDKTKDNVPPLKLTIVYRIETAAAPQDTTIYDGPAGDLIGDVHSVEMLADGKRRITLRYKGGTPLDLTLPADAAGEDLILTWQLPDQPANAPALTTTGANYGIAAIVPAQRRQSRRPSRLCRDSLPYRFVCPPERADRSPAARPGQSPEASAYLGLLDYALESDRQLAGIERAAQCDRPF